MPRPAAPPPSRPILPVGQAQPAQCNATALSISRLALTCAFRLPSLDAVDTISFPFRTCPSPMRPTLTFIRKTTPGRAGEETLSTVITNKTSFLSPLLSISFRLRAFTVHHVLPPIALVPSLLHRCCLGTRGFSKRTSSSPSLFSSLLFLLSFHGRLCRDSAVPFLAHHGCTPLSSSRRCRACRARKERKGEDFLPPRTCQTSRLFPSALRFLSASRTAQAHSCASVAF